MAFNPKDHYFRKAKQDNFVARSVYKLEEIDSKFKLVKSGMKILDLGASPGSWTQYALSKIGSEGIVCAVDLQDLKVRDPRLEFLQGDAFQQDVIGDLLRRRLPGKSLDLVLSDMAPKTTGIKVTDQARSLDLCLRALEVAEAFLKPQGHLVVKFFHSDDFQVLKKRILQSFEKFEAIRPDSTRSMSKEIFLVGLRKKLSTLASKGL
ncbi:MAG: RlmE family RNA methyltransferase [Bdellovibrio sp.]